MLPPTIRPLLSHCLQAVHLPSIAIAVATSITIALLTTIELLHHRCVAVAPSSSLPSPSDKPSIAIAHQNFHHHCAIHLVALLHCRCIAVVPSSSLPSLLHRQQSIHCHCVANKPSIAGCCRHDTHHHCLSIVVALPTSLPSPLPLHHPSPSCHPLLSPCSIAVTSLLHHPQAFHHRPTSCPLPSPIATSITVVPSISVALLHCLCIANTLSSSLPSPSCCQHSIHRHCIANTPFITVAIAMSITLTRPLPLRCRQAIHCHFHCNIHHCHAANNPSIPVAVPISCPLPSQLRHSSPLPVHCCRVTNKPSILVAVATSITFAPSIAVALLHCGCFAVTPSSSLPLPSNKTSIAITHSNVHHRCTIHLHRVAPLPLHCCRVVLKSSITVAPPTIHPSLFRCQHAIHCCHCCDVHHCHLSVAIALLSSHPSPSPPRCSSPLCHPLSLRCSLKPSITNAPSIAKPTIAVLSIVVAVEPSISVYLLHYCHVTVKLSIIIVLPSIAIKLPICPSPSHHPLHHP
jgi:hypothetical protein